MTRTALLAIAVSLSPSCSSDGDERGGCPTTACPLRTNDAGAPVITDLNLHEQLDGDPWTLIFAVSFTDSDGDLSPGQAEIFLQPLPSNDQPGATQPPLLLDGLFRQSGLAGDAQSGQLSMALRFGEQTSDGASVRLGLQLVDADRRRSNCFTNDLVFDVP